MHPHPMDQAPPHDPPRSKAPNHPTIQNTNVVRAIHPAQTATNDIIPDRAKRYSFWKYCDNIVEILYGKNPRDSIEDIVMQSKRNADGSNTLNIFRMVWKDKQWKIKTGKTRKRP
eukprot:926619_1